ncbi:MAG: SIS domain-containing protein [Phycisphaerales bacterium]
MAMQAFKRLAVEVPLAHASSELDFARMVIAAQSRAVGALGAGLGPPFHEAVDALEGCARAGGTVLVSGLGKSGLIGAKISATLASLGVASHFVHPAEAAHGDLGRFRKSDVCLALSLSGETDEVVNLAAILRQDEITIIAVTAGGGRGQSSLERLATINLAIGGLEEEAAISPAPTLSTTATLALGDALALCAGRRLGFTSADFLRRHPGGSLGGLLKPIMEALRFVVGKNLTPVPDDVTVAEALRLAEATARRPGAILLVDRATGVLTGLFTDGDLRRLIERDRAALDRPITDVMTRRPGTLAASSLVRDAVRMVREYRRDEVPVVDDAGKPVGLLDVQDLIALRVVKE